MAKRDDKPKQPQPRDIIKLPGAGATDAATFVKEHAIEFGVQAGYTPEEAEANYRELMETFADPERKARFLLLERLAKEHGEDAVQGTLMGMVEYMQERDKPKPALKVWTDSEDERRSKPDDGKGTTSRR